MGSGTKNMPQSILKINKIGAILKCRIHRNLYKFSDKNSVTENW
jgi:hypothetical protein